MSLSWQSHVHGGQSPSPGWAGRDVSSPDGLDNHFQLPARAVEGFVVVTGAQRRKSFGLSFPARRSGCLRLAVAETIPLRVDRLETK